MRNPQVNIKDAKKQAQEDMKAEPGFGHITNQLKGNTSQTSDLASQKSQASLRNSSASPRRP